jgi:hypothetical protein
LRTHAWCAGSKQQQQQETTSPAFAGKRGGSSIGSEVSASAAAGRFWASAAAMAWRCSLAGSDGGATARECIEHMRVSSKQCSNEQQVLGADTACIERCLRMQ